MRRSIFSDFKCKALVTMTLAAVISATPLAATVQKDSSGAVYADAAPSVKINGYQISTTVEGYRTVYTVDDPKSEVVSAGMIYGTAKNASKDDMVVGSTNSKVKNYEATEIAKLDVAFSDSVYSQSYSMTMKFLNPMTASYVNAEWYVRAYARLKDGSYLYSDVKAFTIYNVADYLYKNLCMNNVESHDYLYDNILSLANKNYAKIEFAWNNSIVKPDEISGNESVTKAPEPATQTPTIKEEPTTKAPEPTTQQPTTKAPEPVTTEPQGDASIPTPFGMVVSCPEDNTIGIVWGRGDIDSYNIYIDGNKVASGVACAYYTYSSYPSGTHTVSIATVSDGKESERATMTVEVTGSATVEPPKPEEPTTKSSTEVTTTKPSNIDSSLIPAIPDLSARADRMYFKLNNKTNGQYADNQIYWCILGYDKEDQLCYVDKEGNLIRANEGMNVITKGNRKCANICYTLAEKDFVYMPDITSGRMYISYGEQTYITFNTAADGRAGYAGPDLNNDTDPNQDVYFEFLEFTISNKEYWGNTSRVDFYSFPMVTRLIGEGGFNNYPGDADVYDRIVGDIGTRDYIFSQFRNEVPDEFDTLVTEKRIVAPCKLTFDEGNIYGNYFDNYINEFWTKYTTQDLVFKCDAGTFRGRVHGDVMTFTKDGDNGTYTIYKPTTQDVLEGKGNFNRGNSTELVIEAQLCAALNRGVATQPENYGNESAYYKNNVANFYSAFWHNHAVDGYAYGFCYDDVFDHSTLLHYTNPTGLIIDLKW